jgi:hypothetical protein
VRGKGRDTVSRELSSWRRRRERRKRRGRWSCLMRQCKGWHESCFTRRQGRVRVRLFAVVKDMRARRVDNSPVFNRSSPFSASLSPTRNSR